MSSLACVKPKLKDCHQPHKHNTKRINAISVHDYTQQVQLRNAELRQEFEELTSYSLIPPGVYILPQKHLVDNAPITQFNGSLFMRSGVYSGLVLKFNIEIPMSYPSQ